MAAIALRGEERIGLGVAIGAHALLVALIVLRPPTSPMLPPPERMTVTLSDEVALTSTAPNPAAQAAPDVAPELGEPAPPEPLEQVVEPLPQPQPEPRVAPAPQPRPKPAPRAVPKPQPKPKPAPRAAPAPKPKANPKPAARPAPAKAAPKQETRRPAGASRIGDDFLKGDTSDSGASKGTPAAAIGPAVRSSLAGAISRQLKPKWAAPSGADAELLVTVLSWNLNKDGSLAGRPRVVRQEGITDSNRPQADRHAEQAVRAVQLAAPFDLPEQYYDAWKRVASFRFDRKLSQ